MNLSTILTEIRIEPEIINNTQYYRLIIKAKDRGLIIYHAVNLTDLFWLKRKIEEAIENA